MHEPWEGIDHTCMITSNSLKCQPRIETMHIYLVIIHGLLASTFKGLIGLPLVILLARHERTRYNEEYLGDEHAS